MSHDLRKISLQLDRIESKIGRIYEKERIMASDLQVLTDGVNSSITVESGAIKLIQGLADQIAALKNDPVALQALSDQLTASRNALAAAVSNNTPSPAPAVVPSPAVAPLPTTGPSTQPALGGLVLTVIGGTGGGSYASGASIPIVAKSAPVGQTFQSWSPAVNVQSANSPSTTFTMPSSDATVTAIFA
jgi:Divergent InlB B-repeat domain